MTARPFITLATGNLHQWERESTVAITQAVDKPKNIADGWDSNPKINYNPTQSEACKYPTK
jgi:hypothetical protein